MNKFIYPILLALFFCATIFAKQITFDPSSGIVEVDVLINGTISGKFGIDTGADRLYMHKQFALDNDIEILQAIGQKNIQGADGSTKPFAASIKSFQVTDDIELSNLSATVVDLSQLSNGVNPPDGLIGFQILKEYYVSIDYPNKLLELSTEEPNFLRGRKYTEIPFSQYRHLIIVDVVINDNHTVPMLVDYCASYTTITPALSDLLEISVQNRQAVLESVSIEGVESQEVMTYVSDMKEFKKSTPRAQFEGIIGSSFLYKYNITVDYDNKKIYIRE